MRKQNPFCSGRWRSASTPFRPNYWLAALTLDALAQLLERHQQDAEALFLYRRALTICEETPGPEHPDTVAVRERYARLHTQLARGESLPGGMGESNTGPMSRSSHN